MAATVLALVALLPVGAASMITGDFSQMVYKPTRRAVYLFLRYRFWVVGVSSALWVIALVFHFTVDDASTILLVATGLGLAFFTLLGFVMSPHVVFPSLGNPSWISAIDALEVLQEDEDVIGVSIDGDARAYPVAWSFRPHLVEETIGGEQTIMSYCLLSNLAVTFKAELNDTPMKCIMPIQWENNMVVYDTAGDRLIQQIDGKVLHGHDVGQPLETFPTQIMPWSSWRALFPESMVLHNPPGGLWDRFVRRFIGKYFLEANRRRDKPMFPTIDAIDDRLPSKAEVVGVKAEGVTRAYPVERLVEQEVVNDEIAGVPIVLAAMNGSVAVFERRLDGDTLEFTPVSDSPMMDDQFGARWDMAGRAVGSTREASHLVAYPNSNRVLWFVWSNFNEDTEVAAIEPTQ